MIHTDSLPLVAADGAEVIASVFSPGALRAAVVCLPALGVPAAYYEPLAAALADRGVAAVTADLRGNGRSSVRPRRGVDFGYAVLVQDAAGAVRAVRQRFSVPTFLLGHSLGGHVGVMLAGTAPDLLDGLLLVACGTPYWRRFPARTGLQILGLAHLARLTAALLGYFPGRRIGFGGREAAQLITEWSRLARRGQFEVAGLDAERACRDVRVRTLAVSIEGDDMAPGAAVDHLAGKLTGAPVRREHVQQMAAAGRSLDHFRWARSPQVVVDVVVPWLDEA
jgi:predicted alpha/beta hydrolase